MNNNYLREYSHYSDQYDLYTIKDCLREVETFREICQKSKTDKKLEKIPEKEKVRSLQYMLNLHLLFLKAEKFKNKEETIRKWMERDRKEQDVYDTLYHIL